MVPERVPEPNPTRTGPGRVGSDILWFGFFRVGYPKALEIRVFSGQYPKKLKKPEANIFNIFTFKFKQKSKI